MHKPGMSSGIAVATLAALSVAACSSDSSPATTGDTTAATTGDTTAATTGDTTAATTGDTTAAPSVAPAGLASQVPAPDGVVYVAESPIDTTGYWTNYSVDVDGGLSLTEYASVLEVLGWTIGDQSESSITATMSGGWVDVLAVSADTGDTVSVCVWNVAPDPDACADFPSSLSESSAPTTDG